MRVTRYCHGQVPRAVTLGFWEITTQRREKWACGRGSEEAGLTIPQLAQKVICRRRGLRLRRAPTRRRDGRTAISQFCPVFEPRSKPGFRRPCRASPYSRQFAQGNTRSSRSAMNDLRSRMRDGHKTKTEKKRPCQNHSVYCFFA